MKKYGRMKRQEHRWGILFITPILLQYIAFFLIPVGFAIYASFTNWNVIRRTQDFIGFSNFTEILSDGKFWIALSNTFYMLLPIPFYLALGLLFALACNRNTPGNRVFRVLYYLPYISSIVALVIMWRWLFNYEFGLINMFLKNVFGIQGPNWLGDPAWIKRTIVIMIIWKMVGIVSIYMLAALKNIPETYYEAAKIDGASAFQCFSRITLPLITPILFYLTITGLIGSLQTFVEVQLFTTDGGRNYSAATIIYYVWQKAFSSNEMGYASATALLFGLFIMLITIIQFRLSRKWVYEEA